MSPFNNATSRDVPAFLPRREPGYAMSQGLTERIIACAIGALRILGPGLLESSDEETLCHEIDLRGLPFERQKEVDVVCEDKSIKGRRIDLTVDGQVVFEIKAVKTLNDAFTSQALSYLI